MVFFHVSYSPRRHGAHGGEIDCKLIIANRKFQIEDGGRLLACGNLAFAILDLHFAIRLSPCAPCLRGEFDQSK